MRKLCIEKDEVLASFDVSSLFTNVLVNEAVDVIQEQLMEDNTLSERINLSPVEIVDLYTCV